MQASTAPAVRGYSSQVLKVVAIIAMTIDHAAWAFVDSYSIPGAMMHIVGRLTAPIMCFFIAEGYARTRSVPRYAGRLFLFALISWFPFLFFEAGGIPSGGLLFRMNMIFTLFLGLIALWAWDKLDSMFLRVMVTFFLCLLTVMGDWPIFGVLYVLAFGRGRGNFKKQALWFSVISVGMILFMALPYLIGLPGLAPTPLNLLGDVGIHAGVFLALPLLFRYNGQKGRGPGGKWLFYIYYPAHLLVIGLIKMLTA